MAACCTRPTTRIAAVAKLDVSSTDIQQCADSVIRLHAEWVWAAGDKNGIAYPFLSGALADNGKATLAVRGP